MFTPVARLIPFLSAALLLFAACAASAAGLLVEDGASRHVIVIAPDASPSEETAAEELRAHFEACTGVALPVVRETPPEGTPMILVGMSPAAEALGVDLADHDLGEQGYVIQTAGPHLVLAGTRAAGTLYAVYDFLETELGVRWFAPGVTRTPAVSSLPLPVGGRTVRPPFMWRHTSYAWPGGDAAFRARQRDNNGSGGEAHPHGRKYEFDGRCHSYFRFVSPGEFFDAHPEYFSEIGGVRRSHETQLCLTNPDVLEIVTERMLARMAELPEARQHNFSQMDYYNQCQCPACAEVNARYGTLGGTQYWFVNELARRTSAVYPDKQIGTLAYMYTEEPPKGMEMHPNVAVWLCHMFPCCDSHPIATCPLDADYKRRARAWSEICGHLYIWHYIVDFAHYYNPFPNLRAMAADLRFYRDIGAEGIYLQGMGHGGGGGEFSLLRPYYGMKLLWNPDLDADAVMREFLDGYYGPAAEPILDYITLIHDKVENENLHMHLYTNPAMGYLTDEVVAEAEALFDRAEAAVAGDADLLERVKVARMPLVYARSFPRNGYVLENGNLVFNGPFASLAEVGEFLERMKRHGFQTIREREGDPQQMVMLSIALQTPAPLATIENAHLRVDAVPWLGGRALRVIEKAGGACITAHNATRNLFFPFAGGEETRRGGAYDFGGMFDQYAVTAQSDRGVTLQANADGFRMTRHLELAEDAPVLTVRVTAENVTDKPREITLRAHVEFDLGALRETGVRFTDRDGQEAVADLDAAIANYREGAYFLDRNAPDGAWTFTGTKGIEVVQRFDAKNLDFAWVYAYPESLGQLDAELWRERITLAPGEEAALEHSLEVRARE